MANDRNYYVLCDSNCKFPSMTKEQILTAITQAVENGEVKDVDTGFVTKIKEQNTGEALSFWVGTQAQYNAIEAKANNCFYIISDDTTGEDLKQAIEDLKEQVDDLVSVGLPPAVQIRVTLLNGSIECKDENGESVTGKKTGANEYTFYPSKFGTYYITATYGEVKKTTSVNVDTVTIYKTSIAAYDDEFENNSWDTIIGIIKSENIPTTWNVGDEKDGITIIGKNHDIYSTGGTAPITFGVECEKNYLGNVNSAGDWHNTTAYTKKDIYIKKEIPDEVFSAIKPVIKTSYYNGNFTDYEETAFLLSVTEVFGLQTGDENYQTEGKQYSYFKAGNKIDDVWLRSWVKNNWQFYKTFVTIYNDFEPTAEDVDYQNIIYYAFCL